LLQILSERAFSFLGLGDPNVVSWGSIVGTGREALRTASYMIAVPGSAIALTVLAFDLRLAKHRRADAASQPEALEGLRP
jgi:peptide/nickel transport system permease protein